MLCQTSFAYLLLMRANKLKTAALQGLLACLHEFCHVYYYIHFRRVVMCSIYINMYIQYFLSYMTRCCEYIMCVSHKIDHESVLIFSYLLSFIYTQCSHFSLFPAFGPNNAPSHVFSIAYFNDHIYFSDPGNRDIYRANMTGHKTLYLGSYDYLSDLKIVEPRKGSSVCVYFHPLSLSSVICIYSALTDASYIYTCTRTSSHLYVHVYKLTE